jgi:uncharacterized protein (TIGR03435 family)
MSNILLAAPKNGRAVRRAALLIFLAGLLLLVLPPLHGQTAAPAAAPTAAASAQPPDYVPTLTFDVASIRETNGVVSGGLKVGVVSPPHTSKFTATNFTINTLLQVAYGFGTPISGGPEWIHQRYFNVEAKSDPSVDAQLATLTDDQAKLEKQHMLQALLIERCHLKFHLETKEFSVFALSVAKGGSKLQPIKADPDQPNAASRGVDVQAHGSGQGLEFVVHTASMRSMVGLLSSQVEAPVLDRTGLLDYYNFTLQFGRDWSSSNPDSWPDIYTAIQEQLGLKLESTRAPVEVLVIDHIDLPSEN